MATTIKKEPSEPVEPPPLDSWRKLIGKSLLFGAFLSFTANLWVVPAKTLLKLIEEPEKHEITQSELYVAKPLVNWEEYQEQSKQLSYIWEKDMSKKWTEEEIIAEIKRVFGSNWETAVEVARVESGLRRDAVGDVDNPPMSYGVFQIRNLSGRKLTLEQLYDPEFNIKYAFNIFKRQEYKWKPAWLNTAIKLGIL